MLYTRVYRREFMECSAAAVGWHLCFGAPAIVEAFTRRIELLARQSIVEFQMAFERRTGEKWERTNKHRRMTVSSDRRRLDLITHDNRKLMTRLQSADSVLVCTGDDNNYVEAEVNSETGAYDLEVLHRYKLLCFTRFLLLREPSTQVQAV